MSVAQLTPQICTDQMEFLVEPKNVMKKNQSLLVFNGKQKNAMGSDYHATRYNMKCMTGLNKTAFLTTGCLSFSEQFLYIIQDVNTSNQSSQQYVS